MLSASSCLTGPQERQNSDASDSALVWGTEFEPDANGWGSDTDPSTGGKWAPEPNDLDENGEFLVGSDEDPDVGSKVV
jgi:hypothetical protein